MAYTTGFWRRVLPAVLIALAVRFAVRGVASEHVIVFCTYLALFFTLFWRSTPARARREIGHRTWILRLAAASFFGAFVVVVLMWVGDSLLY